MAPRRMSSDKGQGGMTHSSSAPFLVRTSNSFLRAAREPLIQRTNTSDFVFMNMHESPLRDLAPIALPGLGTRVSRNNSVSKSLDDLTAVFDPAPDPENVLFIEGGFSAPLLAAAVLSAICSWNYGFMIGSMNTASMAMRRSLGISGSDPSDGFTWGLCVSILCLGALVGCGSAATLASHLGRRRALLVLSATCTVGAGLQALSALGGCGSDECSAPFGVFLMLAGRTIAGVASGATTVIVPVYLGEIAPPHLRGTFGVLFQLASVAALLTAQVLGLPELLGTDRLWPLYILGGVGIPSVIQILLRGVLVESPQWLVARGAVEGQEAESILLKLRGVSEMDFGEARAAVTKELDYMQQAALSSTSPIGGGGGGTSFHRVVLDAVHRPELRSALLISVACAMAQQFSGINNAINYSSIFLSANGLGTYTVKTIAILMNVGNVIITVVSAWLMDRAGRRLLLLASTISMIVAIGILTLALTHPGEDWTAPCAIVGVVSFVMSFGVGMGPVPWLLPAELFPADRVAIGSSFAASCNWLANFLSVLAFLPLSDALGGLCFLPFAAVLVPFALFVWTRVPETRGKSVQQILNELKTS